MRTLEDAKRFQALWRTEDSERVASRCLELTLAEPLEARQLASETLWDAQLCGKTARASDAALAAAVADLGGAPDPALVAVHVYWQVADDPVRAAAVVRDLERAAGERGSWEPRSPYGRLLAAARAAAAGTRTACALCRHIPRRLDALRDSDVPQPLARFRPPVAVKGPDQQPVCPECGTRYTYRYRTEDDPDGYSPSEYFTLRRVPAVRDQLDHIDPVVRRECAWDRAQLLLDQGDVAGVGRELLAHAEPEARREGLDALAERETGEALAGRAGQLADDPDADVRGAAASFLAALWARARAWEPVHALLGRTCPRVRTAAFEALWRARCEDEDLAGFAAVALAQAADPERHVREAAGWALLRAAGKDPAPALAGLAARLTHPDAAQRYHAVLLIERLGDRRIALDAVAPALAGCLDDPALGRWGLKIACALADRGVDMGPFLPAIRRLLARPPAEPWQLFSLVDHAFTRELEAQALVPLVQQLLDHPRAGFYAKRSLDLARRHGFVVGIIP